MMLGSVLLVVIILTAAARAYDASDVQVGTRKTAFGALYSASPDRPYLTGSLWERTYRFFLPYGLDFGSLDAKRDSSQ
jgi:hypothetical protein